MRWFKHFTDNHRGQSIQTILDEHGHTGLSCYWILVELCAEKLEKSENDIVIDNCVFGFHQRILASAMRLKPFKVKDLLVSYQTNGLLTFSCSDSIIKVEMPILLDLLDYGQKKPIRRRFEKVYKTYQDKETDKDKDKETDNNKSTEPKKSVAVVKPKTLVKVSESLTFELKNDLIKSWADTYPQEFLELELKKAKNWILSNPHKAPKSNFSRFLNTWFDRGFENYRKTLKSNPTMLTEEMLEEILRGQND